MRQHPARASRTKRPHSGTSDTLRIKQSKGVPQPAAVPFRTPIDCPREAAATANHPSQVRDPEGLTFLAERVTLYGVLPVGELTTKVRGRW